jgi:hypothetical protein
MPPSSRDRISVDLRGLKAALLAQSAAKRLTPSDFVRTVLTQALDQGALSEPLVSNPPVDPSDGRVRISLRLSASDAASLTDAARTAGLPLGAYVAGLAAGIPVLTHGTGRSQHLTALVRSSAELSTLSRNLRHLTRLLSQGSIQAAQQYRDTLDTVGEDVLQHLRLAGHVLSDLRPAAARLRPPSPSRLITTRIPSTRS